MVVGLKIEKDEELRAYIKQAINNQVVAITRDEIFTTVKNEIIKKVTAMTVDSFNDIISRAATGVVCDILYKQYKVTSWNDDFIHPVIERKVNEAIAGKDWDGMVDQMAQKKIKELLSK